MKNPILLYLALSLLMGCPATRAQSPQSLKSILINLGAPSCGSDSPEQQLFAGALGGSPTLLQACNAGLPFYNAIIAYNPKDKKVYYSDLETHPGTTDIYMLDYNFSGTLTCPVAGPPLYTYTYPVNMFCFDEDGNNLTMYNYNSGIPQANIKRIDFATGIDIAGTDRPIDFPAGNAPNSISYGDMVILPNGRVFATLGSSPSRLYELVNIDGPGNATAVYLVTMPHKCLGIAYVDGNLIISGSDGSGCYYYVWDINGNSLSASVPFPLGKNTIDMSHMNVGAGASQELIGATLVNANTADIIYQVHLKNKGNIDLTNVQLQNKLTDAFGAGNVSNVSINFSSNQAGLTLNPAYDGVTDINLLSPGQTLPNYPVASDSLTITIQVRATNLVLNQVYLSSVIATGQIGTGSGLLTVTDSSNNGNAAKIDPDLNGVSDDAGEGVPTPFIFNALLAANEWQFTGSLQENTARLKWHIAATASVQAFELQRSTDGVFFKAITAIAATDNNAGNYSAGDDVSHIQAPWLYYRLKLADKSGMYSYSNIVRIKLKDEKNELSMLPNPFTDYVKLKINARQKTMLLITIYDATGRAVKTQQNDLNPGINYIIVGGLHSLSKGVYIMKTDNGTEKTQNKLIK